MYADVIVDIAASETDKIFKYRFADRNVVAGSRVIVPFGKTYIEGVVMRVKETCELSPERVKNIARLIEETPALTPETLELCEYVAKKYYVPKAIALRLFLPVEMRKGKVKEKYTELVFVKDGVNIEEACATLSKTAVKQKEILKFLTENGTSVLSAVNSQFGGQAVKSLISKGFLETVKEKYYRSPYKNLSSDRKNVTLKAAQNRAVNSVEQCGKSVSLIHGVTGSGKTEVYLELIDRTIQSGKTAILLVPEIALTPQTFRQLRARFGDSAAILHSGLSAGERFDEWWRLRNGDAKIAVGARSAIFAPLENLGIIVIDEEHDGSYTSESSPRYSTLEVALKRAELNGAKLVLGSATPSVDTYLKAVNGEYNLIDLPDRINAKPLPEIEIVDMRKEVRRGNNSPFSSALLSELEECLKGGNQAMIFLNQRGYSKTVICTECGHVEKCDFCDVSLTYHKEDDALLCHYCGAKYKMVTACTECGSPYIRYGGVGTERVVAELKNLFPTAKVLRMDRDTTKNKDGHVKILEEFSSRGADILVGTQMIAKGHDFPAVTLVGILDADMSLHFSDYRSGERTFQLLTQVSGRAGRADIVGKVVLQTYSPDNEVLSFAVNYDYKGFFEREISIRKATGFPPFTKIVRVLISGEDEQKSLAATESVYKELNMLYTERKKDFVFFGCMKAPLKKLQNKYRYQVLMRICDDSGELTDTVYSVINKYDKGSVSVYIEVNPNNLS